MPYCGICEMGFTSDEALDRHRTEKKHLSRSEEYQRQVLEAAHSVHVTGFSRSISKEDLIAYFSRFGNVSDLAYIDNANSRWPFAFVKFDNLVKASQVLRHKHHCLSGHFLRVQAKRLKFRDPHRLEGVSEHPNQTSGQQQRGYPGKFHNRIKNINFLAEDLDQIFLDLQKKFLQQNTTDGQIMVLYEELKLSDVDFGHRMEFCKLLHTILKPYFPGCSVVLFGSSVNGFGMKSCDIDIFLDISHLIPAETQSSTDDASTSSTSLLKQMVRKDETPVQMKEFFQLIPLQRIRYLLGILLRNLHIGYYNFFPVPSRRCPIVRFSHKISGITCDFSIQNKLGLCNSYLMKFLSKCDSRIPPLVFAVRVWAKRKKLASVGGNRFTSYALTLMVLFFLQNSEPAVLPSVQEVMDSCIEEEEMVIDGFRCSFPKRPAQTVLPPNENKDLLGDLLKKFFDFFLNLDYEAVVISPRTGKFLPRSECESQENMKTFKMTSICVQDPYILEHNTSANVSENIKTDFIRELSIAQKNLSQTKTTDDTPWGLSHLITEETTAKEIKTKVKSQTGPLNVILPIKVDCLNKELEKFAKKFHNTCDLWCKMMCSFVQFILKDMLLIECCIEKEQLSLKELLKPSENETRDKTSILLSSDVKVILDDEPMKDKESIISDTNNANISSSRLKTSDQVYQKRQSDESIREEVKRKCLKEQDTYDSTNNDFNWPQCSGMTISKFEHNIVPKASITNCENDLIHNSSKVILNVQKPSTSNAAQEKTNTDGVSSSHTETKSDNAEPHPLADSECLLQMLCTMQHYTWRNRKKTRQKIISEWNGSDLEFEKKISEHIVASNETDILKPSLTTFRITVTPETNMSIQVHIEPLTSTCKEVLVFYQFLSSYILRMVSTHFLQWCIMTFSQLFDFSESDIEMPLNDDEAKKKEEDIPIPTKD